VSRLSFSEVVGLEEAKEALLLAAVEPRLGGVLLRGDKGSAKTTLARGLAAVMPGDAPFVELPLGAGEDRVLGALDLADLLERGRPRLRPGLLAEAHGGVLYVDEINLLADHLVDALLDVAVSGVNRVEREGLSAQHPARFVLVASMNPEEGELRPQLLDRFGLTTEVRAPVEVRDRVEAVRRQLDRDQPFAAAGEEGAGPVSLVEPDHVSEADSELRRRVTAARSASASLPDEVVNFACSVAVGAGAEGLRADLALVRAALARARLDGRRHVTTADVEAVAAVVLAHRRRRGPADSPGIDQGELDDLFDELRPPTLPDRPPTSSESPDPDPLPPPADQTKSSGVDADAQPRPRSERGPEPEQDPDPGPRGSVSVAVDLGLGRGGQPPRTPPARGRSGRSTMAVGRPVRTVESGDRPGQRPDGPASALALATRRSVDGVPQAVAVPGDLRVVDREHTARALVVFAVDTSSSMGRDGRLAVAQGAVRHLLGDAYRRRARVSLVAFHHDQADVVLRPTSSTEIASSRLGEMASGGTTPIAAGLDVCRDLVGAAARSGDRSIVVVLTDGRATSGGPDPLAAAMTAATQLAKVADDVVIVDTESGYPRLGLAGSLAGAARARLVPLGDLDALDPGRDLVAHLPGVSDVRS